MDEFVSRMSTQRHVLNVVNGKLHLSEKIFGLSSSAIARWASANQLDPSSEIIHLLKQISSNLFFMATRSQEPVSAEYHLRRQRVIDSVSALERAI